MAATKSLIEEAILEARQLKELAEKNAQQEVIRAVAPKIKALVERQLLGESVDDFEEVDEAEKVINELMSDTIEEVDEVKEDKLISPEEEKKEDSDGDKSVETEYEMTQEVAEKLNSMVEDLESTKLQEEVSGIETRVAWLVKSSKLVKESKGYDRRIDSEFSQLDSLRGRISGLGDSGLRESLSSRIRIVSGVLRVLKERSDKMATKKKLTEGELMLKLAGLPDDVSAEDLNVELVAAEDEMAMGDENLDLDVDFGEGLPGEDEEVDVEFEGKDEEEVNLDDMEDDEVVEIDESMLRREIMRMKKIREMYEADEEVCEGDDCEEADENMLKAEAMKRKAKKAALKKEEDKKKVAKKDLKKESLENSGSSDELAKLRHELAEQRLMNAKLVYANKLLQCEGVSSKQKVAIVERLDEAQTMREAKLVYDSLMKTFNGTRKVNESRDAVKGSASNVVRSGSTTLTEGVDPSVSRWQKLAGIG